MREIKILNKKIQLTPTRIFVMAMMLLLGVSILLRLITPEVSQVPNVQNIPQINTPSELEQLKVGADIQVSAELPEIPKEIAIYETESALDLVVLAQTMSQNLGLSKVAGRNYVWNKPGNQDSLMYSEYLQEITYFRDVPTSQTPLDRERALEAARNFVQTNLVIENLVPDLSNLRIENYGEDEGYRRVNLVSGTLFKIPFEQKINEYDLVLNSRAISPVEIWVGPNYQIVKATVSGLIPDYEELRKTKTISELEILNAVKMGQGTIIFIGDESPATPVDHAITSINLTEAMIEYRSYGSSGIIYPYLKFSGKALLENSRSAVIEIIYPIVRTTSN